MLAVSSQLHLSEVFFLSYIDFRCLRLLERNELSISDSVLHIVGA